MNITPEQVREARRLLNWSSMRLAARLNTSVQTLNRIEKGSVYRRADFRRPTVETIRTALEAAGVEFINADGGGAGVRLRKPDAGSILAEDLNASNDE